MLDFEAYLIALISGDDSHRVMNLNVGVRDADYFKPQRYRHHFRAVLWVLAGRG